MVAANSKFTSSLQLVVLPNVVLEVIAAMILPFNILHAGPGVPFQNAAHDVANRSYSLPSL